MHENISARDALEDFKPACSAHKTVFACLELLARYGIVQQLEGELAAHNSGALEFGSDGFRRRAGREEQILRHFGSNRNGQRPGKPQGRREQENCDETYHMFLV
jgi:hypothetical protein